MIVINVDRGGSAAASTTDAYVTLHSFTVIISLFTRCSLMINLGLSRRSLRLRGDDQEWSTTFPRNESWTVSAEIFLCRTVISCCPSRMDGRMPPSTPLCLRRAVQTLLKVDGIFRCRGYLVGNHFVDTYETEEVILPSHHISQCSRRKVGQPPLSSCLFAFERKGEDNLPSRHGELAKRYWRLMEYLGAEVI